MDFSVVRNDWGNANENIWIAMTSKPNYINIEHWTLYNNVHKGWLWMFMFNVFFSLSIVLLPQFLSYIMINMCLRQAELNGIIIICFVTLMGWISNFSGFSNKFSIWCVCLTASQNIQWTSALCGLMQSFQYAIEQFRIIYIYDPIYQIEIEKLCDKFTICVCLPFRLIVG